VAPKPASKLRAQLEERRATLLTAKQAKLQQKREAGQL
jgi:hypothetical protein